MRYKAFLPLLFFVFTITGCNAQNTGSDGKPATEVQAAKTTMTVDELKQRIAAGDTNMVIVDVRTLGELSGELGAIPGIIHIPVDEMSKRHTELDQFKNKEIAVVCRSGNRSGKATTLLRDKGFNAINVSGGMLAWRKSGN